MINPGTSAVLSFFIPGLGHIYNGQIIIGLLILLCFAGSVALCFVYIGLILAPVIWLYALFSSCGCAKKFNKELTKNNSLRRVLE